MIQKRFTLSGNPFVDTGLHVLACLAKLDHPEQLTLKAVKSVHQDGRELALFNSRLKSFTMVLGQNGPLTQSQYRPKGKQKQLSQKNIEAYTEVLSGFLAADENQSDAYPLCEVCGQRRCFDFDSTVRQAFTAAGIADKDKEKQIGREWFPLAGSLGNDAQALPSASRALSVCARCLFAVHYMPLGLMLLQGKLVCFQSSATSFTQDIVSGLVEDNRKTLLATSDPKVEMLGKKGGTGFMVERLLGLMQKRRQLIRDENLPEHLSLYAWLFTNAGASADCELLEIPNRALQFLWEAARRELHSEVERMIRGESKKPEYQLLTCALQARDYSRLYPFKTWDGASPKLYALYHQVVLNEGPAMLERARRVAQARLVEASHKEQKALQKAGALLGDDGKQARRSIQRVMTDMAERGEFSLTHYDQLFPTIQRHPIRTDFRGWSIIGYYLSHPDADVPDFGRASLQEKPTMPTTHPKIVEIARLYFQHYLERRHLKDFKRDVLDQFRRGKLGMNWLRNVFANLAEKHPDYQFGDWDDLVLDDYGRPQATELLFQMRLELANLYRAHLLSSQIRKEN